MEYVFRGQGQVGLNLMGAVAAYSEYELSHWAENEGRLGVEQAIQGSSGFSPVRSLAELPPVVLAELGDISDVGGPFNSSCLHEDDTPNLRFVTGARRGNQFVLAVESGGMSYSVDIRKYYLRDDGSVGTGF